MKSEIPDQRSRQLTLRRLIIAFFGALLVFLAINLLAAHLMSDCWLPALLRLAACNDDIVRAGWPIEFYEEGGIAFHSFFSTALLTSDILTGVVAAALLALGSLMLPKRTKAK